MKASPVYPKRHLHIGEWLRVSHSAFAPHELGQGSTHF